MKRTHLPLNGLRVLDAAARHLSFTRAADELAVTPAAVGQQVRALEDTLGVVLFRRTTKGLELTPEGEAGLGALRGGFLQFEEAVRAMQAGQSSKSLTIAAPRDLTEKWLLPRLAEIARADGELRFVLVAADSVPDFTEANLDLAVLWGEGPGAHEGEAIESEGMVTVERPGGGADARIGWPGGGAEEALIRVGDAGLAIDAAAEGLGRAIVPELLATRDIAAGRVAVVGASAASRLGYWLVAPLPQWRQKKVQSLVEALGGLTPARFETERLAMRALSVDDAPALHPAYRDPVVMRYWSGAPHVTLDETIAFLGPRSVSESWRGWAITTSDGGDAIGTLGASERRPGVVEIGYLIVPWMGRRGYVAEAVAGLIDRLFADGARRIFADTDPDNTPSNTLLDRLGFRREGLLRAEWETHIGIRDSIIWGLLRHEWRR